MDYSHELKCRILLLASKLTEPEENVLYPHIKYKNIFIEDICRSGRVLDRVMTCGVPFYSNPTKFNFAFNPSKVYFKIRYVTY